MVLFGICPRAVIPYSLQRNCERERSSRTARPLRHLPTREGKRGTTVQCICIGRCERERKRESVYPSSHHAFFFLCDHAGLQGALNSVHLFLGHLWLSSCACRLDAVSMVAIPAGFPFELQLSTDCFYNFQAVNTIACILRRASRVGKKAGEKAALELIILKDSSISRRVRFWVNCSKSGER